MPDNREFIAAVRKEWERFQRGESVNPGVVRSIILRSWERCRAMGLDPDRMARPALTEEAMARPLEEKAELIEVAGNVMQRLYEPISTSRSFISLSDAGGVVLHALWNSAAGYSVPHLALGNVAAESSSGTNAIGICWVEKKPVANARSGTFLPFPAQLVLFRRAHLAQGASGGRAQRHPPGRLLPSPHQRHDGNGQLRHFRAASPA